MSIGLTKTEACVSRGLGMFLCFCSKLQSEVSPGPVPAWRHWTGGGESHGHQNCHLTARHRWQHGTGLKINKKYFECTKIFLSNKKLVLWCSLQNSMSWDVIEVAILKSWVERLNNAEAGGWCIRSLTKARWDYQFTIGHSWTPGPRVWRPSSAWESADQSQSQTHKSDWESRAEPGWAGHWPRVRGWGRRHPSQRAGEGVTIRIS